MVSQLTSDLHTSHQRRIVGATNPLDADAGSVRGQYAVSVGRNLIHASDAFESATKEIGLWFAPEELSEYEPIAWVRGFFPIACKLGVMGDADFDFVFFSLGSWPTTRAILLLSFCFREGSA